LAPSEFAHSSVIAVHVPFAVELGEEETAAIDTLLVSRALVVGRATPGIPTEVVEAGETEEAVVRSLASGERNAALARTDEVVVAVLGLGAGIGLA
jgi:hypothetical protein